MIEMLTTGWMIPSRTNSPPSVVSTQCSSVGRILVLEGIIRPVVSVSISRSIPVLLVDY
jgi:hypothetical protein